MRMFDEVNLKCPACGEYFIEQSKAGDCKLRTYTIGNAPISILASLNRLSIKDELHCQKCGKALYLSIKFIAFLRAKDSKEIAGMRET
jgi:hypothetical protein